MNISSPGSRKGAPPSAQKHKALQTPSAESSLVFDCSSPKQPDCFCDKTHVLSCAGFIGITLKDGEDLNVLKSRSIDTDSNSPIPLSPHLQQKSLYCHDSKASSLLAGFSST